MVKCLECGFETSRLQWTHFKYKCNGKFHNSKEYRKVHPNAKLVDDELAARTAVTLANLIKKHGEIEGNVRWKSYKLKQAYSNTFEYKSDTHGWTEEQYAEYNNSRSVTLSNMVKKYGEEEGLCKWDIYCDRQRYTNSIEYYTEKYGESGEEEWLKYNKEKSKSCNIEFIMQSKEVSSVDAIRILSQRKGKSFVSTTEQNFVDELIDIVGDIKYTCKTQQFGKWSHINNRIYFYDVVCNDRKKVIEYNGDYWHCNPAKYESNYVHPQSGLTAVAVWQHDKEKIDTIKSYGYDVMVIWESDYLKDKHSILKEIYNWWIL